MGNAPRARRKTAKQRRAAVTTIAPTKVARPWGKWLIGLGVLAAIVTGVIYISADVSSSPQTAQEPPPGTEIIPISDVAHTREPVAYALQPPAGGSHHPDPLACRVYTAPVRNENAVHSLEHGAIWIAYDPNLDEDSVADLERIARRSEVLVSPYPGIDSAVVITAWGRQLRLDSADTDLLTQFYLAFHDTTAPEPGAGC